MKPDIEQMFREQHRKMDEAPSKMTWERVHQRLEHHRTRSRMKRIQMMAVAAVVLTIVSFGIVSMLYLEHQNDYHRLASSVEYGEKLVELNFREAPGNDMYHVQNVKYLNQTLTTGQVKVN